ncbi:DUF1801 domain-containing protein [Enterococcus sp. LJL98]
MHVPANSIEELIHTSPHEEMFLTLDHWMQETFPQLERRLIQSETITLIGYGHLANAEKGDVYDSLIGLAPQKNNLSFYIGGKKHGQPILRSYETHFAKSNIGKICLRFRNVKKIDFEVLEAIVNDSIAWNEAQKNNVEA